MATVHPTSIRPLRSELMRSTALTPTQHKGGWKSILGFAAAAVIPFAAPAIATALSNSTMLASTPAIAEFFGAAAGSTLVGAGLGAAAGGIAGGGRGALLGAVGGGAAGYLRTNANPDAGFFGGAGGDQLVGGTSTDAFQSGLEGIAPAVGDTAGLATTSGPGYAAGGAQVGLEGIPPPVTFDTTGGGTFAGDAGGGGGTSLFNRALSSKPLMAGLSKLGTQAIANFAVGDTPDLSPSPEQQAASAQYAAAQAEQGRLLKKKEGLADIAYQEATNVNPADRARQAYADSISRSARAQDAGLRNLPAGTARGSARRRNALDRVRDSGRAYETAYQGANDTRRGLVTQAAGLLPDGSSRASSAALSQKLADDRYAAALAQLGTQQEGVSDIVSPYLDSLAALSKEERDRLDAQGA